MGRVLIDAICQDVAELPYDSPVDQPDVMLVTAEELGIILERHLAPEVSDEADLPMPDAPSPVLMRVEFINIITAHSGGKIGFNKAQLMVDKIIARQMQYYAAMADPQMEAENREQLTVVMEAKGLIEAILRQGGAVAEFMPDRLLWVRTAVRARELAQKMEDMFS